MTRRKKGSIDPRFGVGSKVRVKPGIYDRLFPDTPLGGWSGSVIEIIKEHGRICYLFKLDKRTLASIHPIHRKRCDRDGLDCEIMSLRAEELELDDGTLVPIEHPTDVKTPALSREDQDDRIRIALGLTYYDPIPEVTFETLLGYYRYLAANLKFPIFTSCWANSGLFTRKRVSTPISRLEPPVAEEFDEECPLYGVGIDEDEEFECPLEVIELKKDDPNFELITDYTYWSQNWR